MAWAGDRQVDATTFSRDEWQRLLEAHRSCGQVLRLGCCDARLGFRTSNRGTRHFYHLENPGCPGSAHEMSEDHLNLQLTILERCRALGWHANLEQKVATRRADIIASKDAKTYVFEVQLSPITDEILAKRDADYRAFTESVWLVRESMGVERLGGLPVAHLNEEMTEVQLGTRRMAVADMVDKMLAGQVAFRVTRARRRTTVQWRHARCATCEKCMLRNGIVRLVIENEEENVCGERGLERSAPQHVMLMPVQEMEEWLGAGAPGVGAARARPHPFGDHLVYSCRGCGHPLEGPGRAPIPMDIPDERAKAISYSFQKRPHWCIGQSCPDPGDMQTR